MDFAAFAESKSRASGADPQVAGTPLDSKFPNLAELSLRVLGGAQRRPTFLGRVLLPHTGVQL